MAFISMFDWNRSCTEQNYGLVCYIILVSTKSIQAIERYSSLKTLTQNFNMEILSLDFGHGVTMKCWTCTKQKPLD